MQIHPLPAGEKPSEADDHVLVQPDGAEWVVVGAVAEFGGEMIQQTGYTTRQDALDVAVAFAEKHGIETIQVVD